jgi:hypothetical protein
MSGEELMEGVRFEEPHAGDRAALLREPDYNTKGEKNPSRRRQNRTYNLIAPSPRRKCEQRNGNSSPGIECKRGCHFDKLGAAGSASVPYDHERITLSSAAPLPEAEELPRECISTTTAMVTEIKMKRRR